ncbi:YCF48-related protein [Snuella sedimenti]|uniref:T9SS type A sorting domain-containing protein n=1 Tax=Snuella sedimenti TaxID=2798802 RepID=A0A8J7IM37_9FLAO|nr:YCF48-related protein [Snuella sedimenti]MBJ6366927.1 T9SS type A sorting domain-containing protein [Snuella sedimenti]
MNPLNNHFAKLLFYSCFLVFFNTYSQPTWQTLTAITPNINNQRFDDIFFLDENIGWAANGFYAAVYKTIDGGKTWTEQLNESELGGDYYFRNIEFLNEDIGFLGTLNGKFFITSNGGDNWEEVTNISPNPSAICGLDTVGESTIYGCGAYFSPAYIIKSTDSGSTWQYIDMSAYANALVEIYFLTESVGYASGRSNNGATILKTTDGGSSWTEIYNSNITGEYFWKLQVLESNTNIIFGSISSVPQNPGKLVKTNDGGQTWSSYNAPETDVQAVGFISENRGWMGGHTTGFYETEDGGQTWTNLNTGSNLNRIFIINSNLAYASGTSLYKFTDETLSTKIVRNQNRAPLNISFKNNPVTSTLEFDIVFESIDNLVIELYNSNGKYIKQLSIKNNIQAKTPQNYAFSVEDLASGVYFINFHNNTGRESKKFIKK